MRTGWPVQPLAAVAETRLGKMLDQKKATGQHPRPYIKNTNVQWFRFELDDLPVMDFDERERTEFLLRDGDVLVCEGGEVGRSAIWKSDLDECYFQKAIHRVRTDRSQLLGEYLVHFMYCMAGRGALSESINTATIAHLTGERLKALPIPLPPIEEQRRIAAILDKADDLRAKRRAALAHLDSLSQSIFLDMFGAGLADTVSWPTVPLGSVVNPEAPIRRGIDQPGPHFPGGVPYIKSGDFGCRTPSVQSLARADPAVAAQFPRSFVRSGDSVICIRATVGPTLFVTPDLDGANLSRGTARVSPGPRVRARYLYACLGSVEFQAQIVQHLRGATFVQIALAELKGLLIPLPPLDVQDEFVRRVSIVDGCRALAFQHQDASDTLFDSLQHRAFSGTL